MLDRGSPRIKLGEHETVQPRILEYVQAVGWTIVSQEVAEQRRGFDPDVPPADRAKNIALMLIPAPFYDLLCTAVYPELTSRMAMQVGGEDRPDWIMERHWRQFADATGIVFKLVRQRVFTLSQTLPAEAGDEAEGFRRKYGSCEILDQILEVVRSRCRKVGGVLGSDG